MTSSSSPPAWFTPLPPDAVRALFAPPEARAIRKDIGTIDALCRSLIAASPMVMLGSHDAVGRADVSPRGGQPGFVSVLDEQHLAVPEATGNRRIDSLSNLAETGRAGLLFLIPGRDWTLRINGRAWVSDDAELLQSLEAVGKPPRCAVVVAAEEVYAHCPKAFMRSKVWQPEMWPDPSALPAPAEVTLAHLRDPELTLADVERTQHESLRYRLD